MVSSRGMKRRELERAAQILKRARLQLDDASFYLDGIPTDELGTAMKFLSSLPNAANWETHIHLREVAELLGISGELGQESKARFSTLCISSTVDCSDEHKKYGWKLRKEGMGWTDDIRIAHEFILAGRGEPIKSLTVGDKMFDKRRDGAKLVDDFLEYCPNFNALSICDKQRMWTKRFGGQLDVLEIATDYNGRSAIPKYCTRLCELTAYTPCHCKKQANDIQV